MKSRLTFAALFVLFGMIPASLPACNSCFGDPDSPLTQGAKAGVIFLGVAVYGVIMAMGGVLATWIVRAKRLEREEAAAAGAPGAAEPA